MANLDDMNKSLDDIILKLERILELQDKAIKNNIDLQARAAELKRAPVRIGAWACNYCDEINGATYQTCSHCGRPR